MSAIKLITINEYDSVTDLTTAVEVLKETEYNNIQMNMGELAFNLRRREIFKMWSRIEITRDDDSIGYYYVTSATSTLFDKLSKEKTPYYEHNIIFTEITEKLKLQLVSNLSFNDIVGSTEPSYANLFEVIQRINLVSPLEIVGNVLETRVTTSEHSGSSSDASNIVPKMSNALKNALENFTDVPEFTFTGNNMFEAYNTVLNLVGGAVEVKYNADGTTFLDIRLYDVGFQDKDVIDIKDFFDYNEIKDTTNYATHAEVRTDNIIDKKSIFIAGERFFKWIGSTTNVIDEGTAILESEKPLYRLIRVRALEYKKTLPSAKTVTAHVVEKSVYDLLPVAGSGATTQDTLIYNLNSENLKNFNLQVTTGETGLFTKAVWQNMFDKVGLTTNELENVVWELEFIPLFKTNRFAVTSKSFIENNIESYLNININDRINESNRVIINAKNKASQANAKRITKRVKHKSYADVFNLGAYDKDTTFKIAIREFDYKLNVIYATYILVNELNYISDFVGVNSINRFTDIDIAGGLERREFYQDYVIFTEDSNLVVEDTAALSRKGKEMASNLFDTTPNALAVAQFITASAELPSNPLSLVNAGIITGNSTLVFNCDFLNQTFTGKKVVEGDESFYDNRNINRGVSYTDSVGIVKAVSLNYGYFARKNFTNLTDDERKNLPEVSKEIINIDDPLNIPLINFGSLATENTSKTETLGNNDSEFKQSFGLGNATKTDTHVYTINSSMKHTTGYSLDIYVQEVKSETIAVAALRSVTVEVKLIATNGVTFTESNFIPGTQSQEFFLYQNPITLSKSYNGIDVDKIEVKFTIVQQRSLIPIFTNFAFLRNFQYNYVEKKPLITDGLLVDKNQNETLSVAYQVNYTTMPRKIPFSDQEEEYIVLGDALTQNNALKIHGFNRYSKLEFYESSNARYSKYATSAIGPLNPDATFEAVWEGDFEKIRFKVTKPFTFSLRSYGIVGVDSKDKRYFLFGVNKPERGGDFLSLTTYIHFSHNHPKIRKLSQI